MQTHRHPHPRAAPGQVDSGSGGWQGRGPGARSARRPARRTLCAHQQCSRPCFSLFPAAGVNPGPRACWTGAHHRAHRPTAALEAGEKVQRHSHHLVCKVGRLRPSTLPSHVSPCRAMWPALGGQLAAHAGSRRGWALRPASLTAPYLASSLHQPRRPPPSHQLGPELCRCPGPGGGRGRERKRGGGSRGQGWRAFPLGWGTARRPAARRQDDGRAV